MEGGENYENNNNESPNEENENENENEYQDEISPEQENEVNDIMYIYEWVDSIPLSRQKKNIARDFNDAVLLAEMIKFHYPRLVELHNYPSASSTKQKLSNWNTLNNKVLKKLGLKISKEEINNVMNSKPNAIENLLKKVHRVIHNLPQESQENQNINYEKNNDNNVFRANKKNFIQSNNNFNNEEAQELQEKIAEKEQEITEMEEHLEDLKKRIEEANQKQNNLEKKWKELNEFIINNEIDT
jgi:hypothetical protein